jgi:hypothetical protein
MHSCNFALYVIDYSDFGLKIELIQLIRFYLLQNCLFNEVVDRFEVLEYLLEEHLLALPQRWKVSQKRVVKVV